MQYSPMSEDSDDSRFCEGPVSTCSSHPDSVPTSPVSPYRNQRSLSVFSSPNISSHPSSSSTITPSQPRQRGSDSEGRFPSSPSDICHSADLRRAALLRSVQMRAQPPGLSSYELPYGSSQEQVHNIEVEERPCSYMKSLVDQRGYQMDDCSLRVAGPEYRQEKSCRALNMKDEESHG